MSPDIAIDRVRSFIRWNGGRFDALDEEHEAIVDPVGWRRRQGEKREYWIKPKVWREEIFDGDEDQALAAGQALKEADLLRVQSSDRCQAVVALAPNGTRTTRAYVVRGRILDVALLGDEPAAGQVVDQRLVDRRALELEVVKVLGKR